MAALAYEWTVYATLTAVVVAVVAMLGTALFSLVGRFDRMVDRFDRKFDRVDERFAKVDERFGKVDARLDRFDARFEQVERRLARLDEHRRQDKAEILERLDVVAERLTRLEAQGGSAA